MYDRHAREIDSLREKAAKDIELAKEGLSDLYEKKIEYLTEAKDESQSRLLRTERLLKDKEKEYDSLLTEYRKIEKISDDELRSTRL